MTKPHIHFDSIFRFLQLLEANNNRDWFKANKLLYDNALGEFKSLIKYLAHEVSGFDASVSPEKSESYIFRIYRDTRFSNNKEPYKNNFGAFICPGGKNSGMAGYYIHLQSGESFVGGGVYMPAAPILKAIRTEVLFHHSKFKQIIENEDFVNHFTALEDMKLTRPPKGFPADHPAIELAKYTSFVCARKFSNDEILSSDFSAETLNAFRSMVAFNSFINDAIRLSNEK